MVGPKLKVALVGCGRIGAFTRPELRKFLPKSFFPLSHAEAIKSIPGLKLVAVCDKNPEALMKAAKKYEASPYFDFEKMIKKESPEIVSIATRTEGRAKIISFAANHGVRGIHFEKPLSRNLAEAKKAMSAVKNHKVAISYGNIRRYMKLYQEAKNIIASNKLGKLTQIKADFKKSHLFWGHPHVIDLMIYYADGADISFVKANLNIDRKTIKKELLDSDPLLNSAKIQFKNGLIGNIGSQKDRLIKLICSNGYIIISEINSLLEIHAPKQKTQYLKIKSAYSGRQMALIELKDFILNNKLPTISPDEVLLGQKALLGLALSGIKHGLKIPLSRVKDKFTVTGRIGNLYA